MTAKQCQVCGKRAYSNYCFTHKPRKPIKQVSDKQAKYHNWLEDIARPYLIDRLGNKCSCCSRPAIDVEKLDIEHAITKGSRPDLKQNLDNLTLMFRKKL